MEEEVELDYEDMAEMPDTRYLQSIGLNISYDEDYLRYARRYIDEYKIMLLEYEDPYEELLDPNSDLFKYLALAKWGKNILRNKERYKLDETLSDNIPVYNLCS